MMTTTIIPVMTTTTMMTKDSGITCHLNLNLNSKMSSYGVCKFISTAPETEFFCTRNRIFCSRNGIFNRRCSIRVFLEEGVVKSLNLHPSSPTPFSHKQSETRRPEVISILVGFRFEMLARKLLFGRKEGVMNNFLGTSQCQEANSR